MSIVAYNGGLDPMKIKVGGTIVHILNVGKCLELVNFRVHRVYYEPEYIATKLRAQFGMKGMVLIDQGEIPEIVPMKLRQKAYEALIDHLDTVEVNWEQMNEERENAKTRSLRRDRYIEARTEDKKRAQKLLDGLEREEKGRAPRTKGAPKIGATIKTR